MCMNPDRFSAIVERGGSESGGCQDHASLLHIRGGVVRAPLGSQDPTTITTLLGVAGIRSLKISLSSAP